MANLVPFTINPDDFSLEEIEEIETLGGKPFTDVLDGSMPFRFIRAAAFVAARRGNPELTFEETGRWTIAQLTASQESIVPPA